MRSELALGLFDPLDVQLLADHLEVPILGISVIARDTPEVRHLLDVEPEVFSAVTVFAGRHRTIVHNDAHAATRQRSNIAHELSHALLGHPPTPALDDIGCRDWDQDVEDEANWLSGCLLVPEAAAMAIAKGRWTHQEGANRFEVSPAMIRYRLNATGAARRIARSRARARGGRPGAAG